VRAQGFRAIRGVAIRFFPEYSMTLFDRGRPFWPPALLALSAALAPSPAADARVGAPPARAERPAASAPGTAKPAASAAVELDSDRARYSYMAGVDVGRDIASAGSDLDLASFRRSVENAFAGGAPLLDEATTREVSMALMRRSAQRSGRPVPGLPPGAKAPPVDRVKAGLLVGADVGRSLAPVAAEIDLDVFMRALRAAVAGEPLQMDDAQVEAVRAEFAAHLQTRAKAEAARRGEKERAFLEENRKRRGVIATRSGLQYQVLRQGDGARPRATDRVRVRYRGSLLDGTEFDSSYARGVPAEFALNQVIVGWTEGLGLMPVGAKYKFWIPAELGYGARASERIPADSTLVFEVELLDIL